MCCVLEADRNTIRSALDGLRAFADNFRITGKVAARLLWDRVAVCRYRPVQGALPKSSPRETFWPRKHGSRSGRRRKHQTFAISLCEREVIVRQIC